MVRADLQMLLADVFSDRARRIVVMHGLLVEVGAIFCFRRMPGTRFHKKGG